MIWTESIVHALQSKLRLCTPFSKLKVCCYIVGYQTAWLGNRWNECCHLQKSALLKCVGGTMLLVEFFFYSGCMVRKVIFFQWEFQLIEHFLSCSRHYSLAQCWQGCIWSCRLQLDIRWWQQELLLDTGRGAGSGNSGPPHAEGWCGLRIQLQPQKATSHQLHCLHFQWVLLFFLKWLS